MKVPQTFQKLRGVFATAVEPLRICFQHNNHGTRSFRRSCLALAGPNPVHSTAVANTPRNFSTVCELSLRLFASCVLARKRDVLLKSNGKCGLVAGCRTARWRKLWGLNGCSCSVIPHVMAELGSQKGARCEARCQMR